MAVHDHLINSKSYLSLFLRYGILNAENRIFLDPVLFNAIARRG